MLDGEGRAQREHAGRQRSVEAPQRLGQRLGGERRLVRSRLERRRGQIGRGRLGEDGQQLLDLLSDLLRRERLGGQRVGAPPHPPPPIPINSPSTHHPPSPPHTPLPAL